jgi:hypothetical protein
MPTAPAAAFEKVFLIQHVCPRMCVPAPDLIIHLSPPRQALRATQLLPPLQVPSSSSYYVLPSGSHQPASCSVICGGSWTPTVALDSNPVPASLWEAVFVDLTAHKSMSRTPFFGPIFHGFWLPNLHYFCLACSRTTSFPVSAIAAIFCWCAYLTYM